MSRCGLRWLSVREDDEKVQALLTPPVMSTLIQLSPIKPLSLVSTALVRRGHPRAIRLHRPGLVLLFAGLFTVTTAQHRRWPAPRSCTSKT